MLVPNDKRTNGVRQLSTRAYGWRIANYAAIGSGTGPALVPPSVAIQDNRERRRAPKPGAPLRTGKRTGSSTTAINAVRPSSPAKYRSTTGTRSSPIPPSPTPSSIASSTTLTVSHSRETACARSLPSAPSLTPPRKPEFNSSCRQRHPGHLRRNRWPPSIGTRGTLRGLHARNRAPLC